MNTPIEPAFDEFELAIDSGFGNLHQRRCLLGRAAKEISQLNETDLTRIEGVQHIQCMVQVEQFSAVDIDLGKIVAQRNAVIAAVPRLRLAFARMVDQDHALTLAENV